MLNDFPGHAFGNGGYALEHAEVDHVLALVSLAFGQGRWWRGARGHARWAATLGQELVHDRCCFFDAARAYEHRVFAQSDAHACPEQTLVGHRVTTKIAFDEPEDATIAGLVEARSLLKEAPVGQGGSQIARAFPLTNPSAIAFPIFAQNVANRKLSQLVWDVFESAAQVRFAADHRQHD